MPGLPSVASRLRPHIPAILIALLIFCYVDVFLAVRYSDKLPQIPSNTRGLDVEKAWGDLHQITRRPHPYNSHENDLVRAHLLRRLRDLTAQYPHIQYSSDGDTRINTTYIDPPHAAYFESLNILVLIPGLDTPQAQSGGVLYSAHIDSVASGVGATDDGVGVVCILGLIEYFATHRAKRSVVFNLNDGEEDGLNGAMAFFKHPWSTIPDTFVNFEGSGAGGRPIFFRSTSLLPLRAAISNTHAHANVISGDAFEHRLLRSRTDFTVYSKSLPAPHLDAHHATRKPMEGIDLAFYKHRSYYHTKYDSIPYIEGGKKALWAMMDAGRGVGWELANRPFLPGTGDGVEYVEEGEHVKWADAPVFFDLFNRHLIVFSRSTLFRLDLVVLFLLPLLLFTAIDTRRTSQGTLSTISSKDATSRLDWASCIKLYIENSRLNTEGLVSDFWQGAVSPEGGLFWSSLFFALLSEVALVTLYSTLNPFIVYGHAYKVLATFFLAPVIVIGISGYYYRPSPATTLASFASPLNTQPLTRLLINAYILTYLLTLLATVLVYTAGLGGTYFLTIWGIVSWEGLMGEVFVGGFDVGGQTVLDDAPMEDKKGKKVEKGTAGDEPVELRRSLRKQVAIAAAAQAASKANVLSLASTHAILSAGDGCDATSATAAIVGRSASSSPKKRGRPPKSKKAVEVYVEVSRISSNTPHTTSAPATPPISPMTSAQPGSLIPASEARSASDARPISGSKLELAHMSSRLSHFSTTTVNIHLLLFTRMLQLFITVMVPVILMCHIAQLLVDGMSQTLADGSKGVIVHAALALFGGLMAVPAAPWILAACFKDKSIPHEQEDVSRVSGAIMSSASKSNLGSQSSHSTSRSRSHSLVTTTRGLKRTRRYSLLAAIPLGISVVILQEMTMKNMLSSFPFNSQTPLKIFFHQRIEFPLISADMTEGTVLRFSSANIQSSLPRITTLIVGVPKYIRGVAEGLPSALGKQVRCEERADRKGTVGCEWDVEMGSGLVPRSGVKGGGQSNSEQRVRQEEWFDANITRTGSRSARFEVRGVTTRNCRIYFEEGIVGFRVERVDSSGASVLSDIHQGEGYGGLTHKDATLGFEMPQEGVKLLVLWSRVWGAKWVVDVQWPLSASMGEGGGEEKGEKRLRGRVACEWSEYDSGRTGQVFEGGAYGDGDKEGSSIPAFEEVLAFSPRWVSVSKLYHGMVEVVRGWEI